MASSASTPRKRASATTPRLSVSKDAIDASKGIPVLISLMSGSRNLGSRSTNIGPGATFEELLFHAANITTFTSVKVNGQVKAGNASVLTALESAGGPHAVPAPVVTFQLPNNVKECTCIGCPNLLVRLRSRRACDTCHTQGRNLTFSQVLRLIVPASTNFRTPPTDAMRRAVSAKAAAASSPSAVSSPITGAEALALLASFTHWKFDGSRDVAPNARSSSVSAASLAQLMVGDPNEQILYAVFPSAAEADTMMHEATKLGFNEPPNSGPVRLSRVPSEAGGHIKLRMISHYWKLEIATPSGNALKECLFAKLGKQNQTRQRAKGAGSAKNSPDSNSTGSSQSSKTKSPSAAKRTVLVKAEPIKVESPNSTSSDGSSGSSYSPLQPTSQSFPMTASKSTSNNSFVYAVPASNTHTSSNSMDSHYPTSSFQQQQHQQRSFVSSTGLSQADHNALSLSLSNQMPGQSPQLLLPTPSDPYGASLAAQPSYAAVWSQEHYLKSNQAAAAPAPTLLQYGSGNQPFQLHLPDYHPSTAAEHNYSAMLPPLPPHYSQQSSSLFVDQPPSSSYAATRGDLLSHSTPQGHSGHSDSTDEASSISGASSGHTPTTASGHIGALELPGSAAMLPGPDGDGILKVPAPFLQSMMLSQQADGLRAYITFETAGTGRDTTAPSSQSIPLIFMYPPRPNQAADPHSVASVSQYSPADSSASSPHPQHHASPGFMHQQQQQALPQQPPQQQQQQLPQQFAARSQFPPPLPPLPPQHQSLMLQNPPSLAQPQSYSIAVAQPRQMMAPSALPTPATPLSVTNLTPIAPPDPVGPAPASRRRPREQDVIDSSTMPQIGSLGSAAFIQNPYSSAFFGYSPQSSPNTDLAYKRVRHDGTVAAPADYSPRMPHNALRPGVYPDIYGPTDYQDGSHTDSAFGHGQNHFGAMQGNVVKIPMKPSERPEGISEAQMKNLLKKERWWRFSSFSHNPVLLAIEIVLAAVTIGVLIYIGSKNAVHNTRDISGVSSLDDEDAGANHYSLLVPYYNQVRLDTRAKMVEQNARDLAASLKLSSFVFDNVVALSNVSFTQEPFRNDFIRASVYTQASTTASAVGQLAARLEFFADNYEFLNTTVAFDRWSRQMATSLQSEPLKALIATLCRTSAWQSASFAPPLADLNAIDYNPVCGVLRRLPPSDYSWLDPPNPETPVPEPSAPPATTGDEQPPATSTSPTGGAGGRVPATAHDFDLTRAQANPVFNTSSACTQGMVILIKFFGFSTWTSRFRPVKHPEEFFSRLRVAAVDLRQQCATLDSKATALGIMNREAPHSVYLASRDWELRGSMLVPLLFGAYGLHLLLVFLSWIVYNAWRYLRLKCCPPESKTQPRVFFYTPAPRVVPPPPPGPPPSSTGLDSMPRAGVPETEMERLEMLPQLSLNSSQSVGEGAGGESPEHLV